MHPSRPNPTATKRITPATGRGACAFTLLEIVVVIGILFLLLLLVVPGFLKLRETGRTAGCISNLRQIGIGLTSYLTEHDSTMPTLQAARRRVNEDVKVIDNTFDKYLKDKRVFACPSDPRHFRDSGSSYYWNSALNGQKIGSLEFMKLTEQKSKIPVVSDKEGFHPYTENKVNILYADGHATKEIKFRTEE